MATQQNLERVWASGGTANDTGDLKYDLGWEVEIPPYQEFNYVLQSIDRNVLVLAESGKFTWQADINYTVGARVLASNGLVYTAKLASLNVNPATGVPATWSLGFGFGDSVGSDNHGITISNVYANASTTLWVGSDVTITNHNPLIEYASPNYLQNFLMGNVQGVMCVVDLGTTSVPDGRSLLLTDAAVYKIYHEGNKPVQADVLGTTPVNANNSQTLGRYNNSWVEVVNKTANASGVQVDSGTSTVLYVTPKALTDSGYSGTKATGVDVDAEVNDSRYLTSKALADSDYIKKSEVIDFIYPIGMVLELKTPTNPATLYGVGVWSLLGVGRVTVCIDSTDALFNSISDFGGTKDNAIVGHNHGVNISDPGHTHTMQDLSQANQGSDSGSGLRWVNGFGNTSTTSATTGITATTDSTGSSGTNANVQPYIVVYRWERTG